MPDPLRILHCFRSPVGGVFRHVRDLIGAQVSEGHEVGILCDSITGGAFEEQLIADVASRAALGVHRVTMRRSIAPSDLSDIWRTFKLLRALKPDVLHGHGSKGGAYARIAGTVLRAEGHYAARLYTPHGGSIHYDPRSLGGRVYFLFERILGRMSDHLLFVSEFEQAAYHAKVGRPNVPARVVHNGLGEFEFATVAPAADAADFLYLGMLRRLKGPDLLIEALGLLSDGSGGGPTAVVVGAGEMKDELVALAAAKAPGRVVFRDPMPAREAFRLGRILVLPSRADSLPYVVLEALASGKPVVAVDAGGVCEMIPPRIQTLVPLLDPQALAVAMAQRRAVPLGNPAELIQHVRSSFTIDTMAADTMAAYLRALAGSSRSRAASGAAVTPSAPFAPAHKALNSSKS